MAVNRVTRISSVEALSGIEKPQRIDWRKNIEGMSGFGKPAEAESAAKPEKAAQSASPGLVREAFGEVREESKSANNDILSISVEGKMANGYYKAMTGSFEAAYGETPDMTENEIITAYSEIYDRFANAAEQSFSGAELDGNMLALNKAYNDIISELNAEGEEERKAHMPTPPAEKLDEIDDMESKARELLLKFSASGDVDSAIANTFVQLNSKKSGAVSYAKLLNLASAMNIPPIIKNDRN